MANYSDKMRDYIKSYTTLCHWKKQLLSTVVTAQRQLRQFTTRPQFLNKLSKLFVYCLGKSQLYKKTPYSWRLIKQPRFDIYFLPRRTLLRKSRGRWANDWSKTKLKKKVKLNRLNFKCRRIQLISYKTHICIGKSWGKCLTNVRR